MLLKHETFITVGIQIEIAFRSALQLQIVSPGGPRMSAVYCKDDSENGANDRFMYTILVNRPQSAICNWPQLLFSPELPGRITGKAGVPKRNRIVNAKLIAKCSRTHQSFDWRPAIIAVYIGQVRFTRDRTYQTTAQQTAKADDIWGQVIKRGSAI